MKYLFAILLSLYITVSYSQKTLPDSCFTKKQVLDISYTLDSLCYKDSINELIIKEQKSIIIDLESMHRLDSILVLEKNKQIEALKTMNLAYESERKKHNRWYNRRSIWFGLGVTATSFIFKIIYGGK